MILQTKKNEIKSLFLTKGLAFINASMDWLSMQNSRNMESSEDFSKIENELFWNAKIVDLVELVFALQEAKVFNSGKIHTKVLMRTLCGMFNLKMSDCFAHYMSIRNRPGSRTRFLDKLKVLLDEKMNKDEEDIHIRYRRKQ